MNKPKNNNNKSSKSNSIKNNNDNNNHLINVMFQKIDNSTLLLVLLMILFRCLNSVVINTFFDPDEYWQSLEVAHHTVFGYGYLTWEWEEKIRSFLHPMLFAFIYKLLLVFNLDTPKLVIIAPKLLQGICTAVGDVYLYKLTRSLFGKEVAKWTLVAHLISWYTFVCLVRSYSNSIETILFIIALYYWPLPGKQQPDEKNYKIFNNVQISIILTSFAFIIRPTTAIMWLYLVPLYLFTNIKSMKQLLQFIFRDALLMGGIVLAISIYIDYIFYKEITFVPYNFLYFNVIKNISVLYGTHPFIWYFTQALPTIAFTSLPLFIMGVYRLFKVQQQQPNNNNNNRLHLAYCAIFTIFLYSFLAHKEFRFIFPVLPLVMIYSGYFIESVIQSRLREGRLLNSMVGSRWILLLLLLNIPMIVFFSNVHQRSPIDVIHYINDNISPLHHSPENITSIHFLMSCHATPYQSYIHNPYLKLKILECPPPLDSNGNNMITEKDRFFDDPQKYLLDNYINNHGDQQQLDNKLDLPDYFVVRDDVLNDFGKSWLGNKYVEIKRFGSPLDVTSCSIFQQLKN